MTLKKENIEEIKAVLCEIRKKINFIEVLLGGY